MCVYGFKSDLNTSDGNSNVNSTKAWFVRSTSLRSVLAGLKSHLSLASRCAIFGFFEGRLRNQETVDERIQSIRGAPTIFGVDLVVLLFDDASSWKWNDAFHIKLALLPLVLQLPDIQCPPGRSSHVLFDR